MLPELAPEGIVAVIWVLLLIAKDAGVVPRATEVAVRKFAPVITTCKPGAPEELDRLEIVGGWGVVIETLSKVAAASV